MASVETDWPKLRFGAIGEAWRLYKRHWGVWSLTTLVSLVCVVLGEGVTAGALHISSGGVFGGLIGLGESGMPLMSILLGSMIFGFFLGGMIRMAVNQVRGRSPHLEDLFSVSNVWFDLILGSALLALLVTIGWHLMVVPGLIAAGLFLFTLPLIVDGGLPATGAMIQSFDALKSQWLLATVVHLVMALVAGLGTILGGIGLLVTGPLYVLTIAVLYRELFLNPYSPSWSKPASPVDEY
jgi:hypothetical protein